MTNARYRRKKLAGRDGSLAPLAPAPAEPAPGAVDRAPDPEAKAAPDPSPDAARGTAPR